MSESVWLGGAALRRKCRDFNAYIYTKNNNNKKSTNIQHKNLEKEQQNKPKDSRIK